MIKTKFKNTYVYKYFNLDYLIFIFNVTDTVCKWMKIMLRDPSYIQVFFFLMYKCFWGLIFELSLRSNFNCTNYIYT